MKQQPRYCENRYSKIRIVNVGLGYIEVGNNEKNKYFNSDYKDEKYIGFITIVIETERWNRERYGLISENREYKKALNRWLKKLDFPPMFSKNVVIEYGFPDYATVIYTINDKFVDNWKKLELPNDYETKSTLRISNYELMKTLGCFEIIPDSRDSANDEFCANGAA